MAPKPELVRLAATVAGGSRRQVVVDRAGTLPGRGAYLCRDTSARDTLEPPRRDCLALAQRRRGLARALRCTVTLSPELVELSHNE